MARLERTRLRRWATGYLLVLPALGVVLVLVLYPLADQFVLSLTGATETWAPGRFVGLANYQRLLADPGFWIAARNTVVLVVATAAIALALGTGMALLLWWPFPGRGVVFLAVFVPWAFPTAFSGTVWRWLLLPPFHTFYTLPAIEASFRVSALFGTDAWQVLAFAVMSVWRASSIIAILLLAGFTALPEELLDSGRLDGGPWRTFRRVVVPLSWPFLVLATLVAFVVTDIDFAGMYHQSSETVIMPVLGTLAYSDAIYAGQTGLSAAVSILQMPVALLLAALGLRALERPPRALPVPEAGGWRGGAVRAGAPAHPQVAAPRAPRGRPHGARGLLTTLGLTAAAGVVIFHLLPLYFSVLQAVRPIGDYPLGNPFWTWHPDFGSATSVLSDEELRTWAWNTLVVFGAALAAGLTLALLAGYGLARFDPPGARWLARLVFSTYFVPQVALLFPDFAMLRALGLDDTGAGLALLYLTLVVPFATWLFYAFFRSLDPAVEEHALLDGSRLSVLRRILLPMSRPVVIAAALFGIGMMGSDVLYAGTLSLTDASRTLPVGLGLNAIALDEWAHDNAALVLAALPLVAVCVLLGPSFVRGLRSALIEGA